METQFFAFNVKFIYSAQMWHCTHFQLNTYFYNQRQLLLIEDGLYTFQSTCHYEGMCLVRRTLLRN